MRGLPVSYKVLGLMLREVLSGWWLVFCFCGVFKGVEVGVFGGGFILNY